MLTSSPEDFPRFLQAEIAKWDKVVKFAGIRSADR